MQLRAVKELVAILKYSSGCSEALEPLHGLFLQAGAGACAAAVDAQALPLLLCALSDSKQRVRQRAARMLGLIIELLPDSVPKLLELDVAAKLSTLLCGGTVSEKVEALDALYLLRTSEKARSSMATAQFVAEIAMLLSTVADVAPGLTDQGKTLISGASALGVFPSPHKLGSTLSRSAIAGKSVRLLLYLARDAATWRSVAECHRLAAPLAQLMSEQPMTISSLPPPQLLRVHHMRAPLHSSFLVGRRLHSRSTVSSSGGPPVCASLSEAKAAEEHHKKPVVDVPEELLNKLEATLCGTGATFLAKRVCFLLHGSPMKPLLLIQIVQSRLLVCEAE
jgi:hypothetical protein